MEPIIVLGAVLVVAILDVAVVIDADVDVVVDELQDASNITIIIERIKPKQINLFFNFILHFIIHENKSWRGSIPISFIQVYSSYREIKSEIIMILF